MAFDGIMTRAVALELQEKLTLGKIEKVYQPEADELIFSIYTKQGNV
ncbi:MAG: NFACT family protein, partial [Firmicutes bacterium]|nr:NFACT family protein [Bacillota bacterium]